MTEKIYIFQDDETGIPAYFTSEEKLKIFIKEYRHEMVELGEYADCYEVYEATLNPTYSNHTEPKLKEWE